MAEENETNEQEVQKPKKASSGGNPLLTILVLLNTFVIGVVGYLQYISHQELANQPTISDVVRAEMLRSEQGESIGQAIQDDGILFPLETFTANLAQGDGPRRFIRLNAVLKFSQNSSESEFRSRQPQIRDVIISILNSKRPDDLLRAEGKNYLKEEIKSAINAFLIDGEVIDVFYVGFQIS